VRCNAERNACRENWFSMRRARGIAPGLASLHVANSLACSGVLLIQQPDCDVGQFSHSRLARGPQPLIDCLPEIWECHEPERGAACGTCTRGPVGTCIKFTQCRALPGRCDGVRVRCKTLIVRTCSGAARACRYRYHTRCAIYDVMTRWHCTLHFSNGL